MNNFFDSDTKALQIKVNDTDVSSSITLLNNEGENSLGETLKSIRKKIDGLNFHLAHNSHSTYNKNKELLLGSIKYFEEKFSEILVDAEMSNAVLYTLGCIKKELRRCSPTTEDESPQNKKINTGIEEHLFQQQDFLSQQNEFNDFLESLPVKFKKDAPPSIYVVCEVDDLNSREKKVPPFLKQLIAHLQLTGCIVTLDNSNGSTLRDKNNILDHGNTVWVLGTETLRNKWLQSNNVFQYRDRILEEKYNNDFAIDRNKKTIIPNLLTGSRYTSFPDKLNGIDYSSDFYNIQRITDYLDALVNISAIAYGVDVKRVKEIASSYNFIRDEVSGITPRF